MLWLSEGGAVRVSWSRSGRVSAAGVPRERQRAGRAPRRHLYLIRGQNSSIRFRRLIRLGASLLVLFGSLALFATSSAATTVTASPNGPGSCDVTVSTTSSTWVAADDTLSASCSTLYSAQITSAASTGSGCVSSINCGYYSGPITLQGIEFGVWTGSYEITGGIDVAPLGGGGSNNLSYCGFNTVSTLAWSVTNSGVNSGLTSALYANPPTVAGTAYSSVPGTANAVPACYTSSNVSSAGVYAWVSNGGTTDSGDYAVMYFANNYCDVYYATACESVSGFNWSQKGWTLGISATTDGVLPAQGTSADCTLVSITGPANEPTQVAGSDYVYTIDFVGDVDGIVAIDDNDTSSGTAFSQYGKSFELPVIQDYDPGPALDSPQSIEYQAETGDVVNPDFWCEAQGTWYHWGTYSSIGGLNNPVDTNSGTGNGSGSGGAFGLGTCFASAGWSLTDPVTWVTGALHDGQCILQWLFEPTSSSVQSVEQVFGLSNTSGECTGAVGATQWVGCIGKGVLGTPVNDVTAFQSAVDSTGTSCSNSQVGSDSGVFAVDNPVTGRPVDSISFCTVLDDAVTAGPAATSNTSAAFVFLHGLLVAAFWLAMVFVLIRFLASAFFNGSYGSSGGDGSGGGE